MCHPAWRRARVEALTPGARTGRETGRADERAATSVPVTASATEVTDIPSTVDGRSGW